MSELKTNYKDAAKRYLLAERQIWSKLSNWKKAVVMDCRKNDLSDQNTNRIFSEYATNVVELAESSVALDDTLPSVPIPKRNLSVEAEPEPLTSPP